MGNNYKVFSQTKNGDTTRAPAMCDCQAIGYVPAYCSEISFTLQEYDGGESDESGEKLYAAKFLISMRNEISFYREEKSKRLFVNKNGDVYRSWKGGKPICNVFTGYVYNHH